MEISISEIKVGENEMRAVQDDEEMDGLTASIRRVGLLCPLVVRKRGEEMVLVAGHRRYRACQIAGLSNVPVVVREDSDAETKEVAFAENLFRADLSPIETAAGMKDVLTGGTMTVEELAVAMHRSVEWVNRMVAICEWPADVQKAVHEKWLSVAAASNLALILNTEYREFLLRQAFENGATARTTAAWLQAWRSMQPVTVAVEAPPVGGPQPMAPMVPQLPCFVCEAVMRMDAMNHLPVCPNCVNVLRQVCASGVGK